MLKESVDRYDYISRKRTWLNHVRGLRGAGCPRCGTPLERITTAALVQELRHLRPDLFANRDQEDGAHRSQKLAGSSAQRSSIKLTTRADISCHHPQGTCRYAGCQASGRCLATRSSAVAA